MPWFCPAPLRLPREPRARPTSRAAGGATPSISSRFRVSRCRWTISSARRRASRTTTQLVGDHKNPILKPHAAEIVRQKGEISLTGNAFPDPSNQCYPYQPPFALSMQLGVQILQEKDQITFLYNQDDQVRRVRLNSTHPAKVTPTWMGDFDRPL